MRCISKLPLGPAPSVTILNKFLGVAKNLVLTPPCHWRPANGLSQRLPLATSKTSRNGLVHTIHSAAFCLVFHPSRSHAHVRLQLDIDPVTAKTPFFAPENATKWAVSEQWHTYWTKRRQEQRHALSLSGAVTSPNHVANR
jgi:hypothetical protein